MYLTHSSGVPPRAAQFARASLGSIDSVVMKLAPLKAQSRRVEVTRRYRPAPCRAIITQLRLKQADVQPAGSRLLPVHALACLVSAKYLKWLSPMPGLARPAVRGS